MKANLKVPSGCRGIEKKQSFMSIMMVGQFFGRVVSNGKPHCIGPMGCMVAFIALRSCSSLHSPDFFLMINMGVLKGDVDGLICPAANCSKTSCWAACNFSRERGP